MRYTYSKKPIFPRMQTLSRDPKTVNCPIYEGVFNFFKDRNHKPAVLPVHTTTLIRVCLNSRYYEYDPYENVWRCQGQTDYSSFYQCASVEEFYDLVMECSTYNFTPAQLLAAYTMCGYLDVDFDVDEFRHDHNSYIQKLKDARDEKRQA